MKIKYFVCQSIISLFFTLSAYTLWAQIPNGYYNTTVPLKWTNRSLN